MTRQAVAQWEAMPADQAARSYADLIINRVERGMPTDRWSVDWADSPTDQKVYPTAQRLILPTPAPGSGLLDDSADGLNGPRRAAVLADLLHLSYGLLSQRSRVNCNDHPDVLAHADRYRWGRGAASGGGRYTVSVYRVVGRAPDLAPGIYHYSPLHHAWDVLALGDHTAAVAAAQGYPQTGEDYLLLTIDYWQSGFKYNDFAYQATSMDVGTLLGTWRYLLGERCDQVRPDMWVNEEALAELLGIDRLHEGVYAVLDIGAVHVARERGGRVELTAYQRSRSPQVFPTTRALQRGMAGAPSRPEIARGRPHALPGTVVAPLPSAGEVPVGDKVRAAMSRETSFGRFDGASIAADHLLAMLSAAARASELVAGDLGAVATGCVTQYVFVERVSGLEPGLYETDTQGSCLRLVEPGSHAELLAQTYFLHNYDGQRAAATIILAGDVLGVSEELGVRGYRIINAAAGAVCQVLSLEASRLGVGLGAALGFDVARHVNGIGLADVPQKPMLMLLVGHDTELSGAWHGRLNTLERNR